MSIYGTNEAKNGDSFDSKSTISNVDKIEILFQIEILSQALNHLRLDMMQVVSKQQ